MPCLEERLPVTATHRQVFHDKATASHLSLPASTCDATKTDVVRAITRKAHVTGYARYTVLGKDYPAGEAYKMEPVTVTVMTTDDQGGDDDTERVEADMYLWDGDPEDISQEGWDLVTFERERLDDWLELFGGMELVGQEDSDDGHS
ncbi:hypothetical protein EV363DRAFT_1454343 [Boletus edulis]|nr:hypothetical protein EV363DRAFT_1454343 [Boletus edulis]